MADDNAKLAACPHCGKEDAFVERSDLSACHVVCNECGARGPACCDETEADAAASENDDAEPGELAARRAWNTRAAPPAMDREAVDFLHQLRRVNTERYRAWASRPLMLCAHCGATEHAETERCAPPFSVQPHSYTKPHPSLTVENDAGIMFDALELGGEVGELLNVVKKLEREERGWRGSRAATADFADECADVLICLDKLARRRGVDLIAATIAKFNATSDKVGLPHKLSTLSADAIRQGEGKYLVWSIEHAAWWAPNEMGYTSDINGAGRYDRDAALAIVHRPWGWDRRVTPDEMLILERDAIALATPASHASDGGKA